MSSTPGSTGSSPPARRRRRRRSSGRGTPATGTAPDATTNGTVPAPQPPSDDPPRGDTTNGASPTRSRRRRGPRRRGAGTTAAGQQTGQPDPTQDGNRQNGGQQNPGQQNTGQRGGRQPGAAHDGDGQQAEVTRPRSGRSRRGRRGRGRSTQAAGQPQQAVEATGQERPASGRVRAAAANSKSRRSGRRLRTVDETSAGGLVVDTESASAALIGRLDRRGRLLWSLPKGHLEDGETAEQAAIREVAEETGINGRVLAPLGTIDYWFVAEDRRVHKTVHHFLMEAVGGELCDEDIEVTEVAWVPLHELDGRLAYADERKLVRLAAGLLSESA